MQLVGALEAKAAEERGVDDGKADRVGADAERDDDDGRGGKPFVSRNQPAGERQVLEQILDPGQATRLAVAHAERR